MSMLRTLIGGALLFLLCADFVSAESITLRSEDDGLTLTGEVLGFDGTYLRLETEHGVLTVDMTGMACTGEACPERAGFVPEIVLAGSTEMAATLLPALIEAYGREAGLAVSREERGDALTYELSRSGLRHLRMVLRPMTTQEGFEALLTEETDLVLASRPPSPSELMAIRDAGHGDLAEVGRFRTIAWGGVEPVTSSSRDLSVLQLDDLGGIWSGAIREWSELAEPGDEIGLHVAGSGTGPIQFAAAKFRSIAGEAREEGGHAFRHRHARDVLSALGENPDGLGLVNWAATGATLGIALGGPCGLSVAASHEALQTGDYPLAVPYRVYLPARRLAPDAASFIDWLDSRTAERVVRRVGFADAGQAPISLASQGERLAHAVRQVSGPEEMDRLKDLLAQLDGAERLTPTFRFETSSANVDVSGREIALRLARAIDGGEIARARVLFVGFHDGREPADDRSRLAARRAEAALIRVARAMVGAVPENVALEIASGGDALAVACSDTAWGRQLNRRVEVWVAPLE